MVKQYQLQLVPTQRRAWQLSAQTKEIGKAGLAQARRALAATPTLSDGSPNSLHADLEAPVAA